MAMLYQIYLTLTRVVFEYEAHRAENNNNVDLTLTRVVFE